MRTFLICGWLLGGMLLASDVTADDKKPDTPAAGGIEGIWQGKLKIGGGAELRLVVHISRKDGKLTGTLDSPDQGAKGLPLEDVEWKDGTLRFELKVGRGSYEGKANKDGTEVEGTWKQGGASFPLTFKHSDKGPEPAPRPQTPKWPFPYREEEVGYDNKKAGVHFAGTLTLPRGDGPFPAVLLITGSGPQDRDETIFEHKPFLVLADYLTRRGIAVLRVDDRGVGGSTGRNSDGTTAEFADDALAGVEFLKGRKEINPHRIGLAGHSEGGIIAPLAATKSSDVAFIVMMAGTALSGEEILYLQGTAILRAAGADDEAVHRQRAIQEKIFAVLRAEKDNAAAEKKLRELFQAEAAQASSKEKETKEKAKGDGKSSKGEEETAAVLEGRAKQLLTPWFRFFLQYDPAPALRQVTCPVLAINGEKDRQVPPRENLPAIAKALMEGGNPDVTVRELPSLNHLFQHAKTGGVGEYGMIEETIAPIALEVIGDWIVQHTRERGK